MSGNLSNIERKFVESMLESAKKSAKIEPESQVNLSEVEELTKSIQRRIQRGEVVKGR